MALSLPKSIKQLALISPFFYPAYLLKFQLAGIPFTALEIFCYLLFGLWLIGLLKNRENVVWDKRTKYYWYAVFLLLIGGTIGVLATPDFISLPSGEILNAKRTALGVWKGWILAPMLYFAVLTQVLTAREYVEKILRVFVYSAALLGIASHIYGLFWFGVTIDLRLSGFFESANYLALYLVPAILINIYFFFRRPPPSLAQRRGPRPIVKIQNYIDISTLTILLYCLFFTQSYAGVIAVFGAIGLTVLYYFYKNPKQRKKIGFTLLFLFAAFAVVVITQMNTAKFKQALDWQNRSSTSVRLEIYRTSWDMIKKSPLFGLGPGLFQANYQNQAPVTLGHAPLEWNMPHPHNIFLGFWMNAGLIGLIAFILIVVLAHQKFTYPLIVLWGILIHGLFDMPFWKNDLAMIFWLIIACILVLQKQQDDK